MHALLSLALVAPSLIRALIPTAAAQQAVSMEAVRFGQVGTTSPGMTFTVHQAASSLQIRVDCGGKTQEHQGPAAEGDRIELRFEVPQGTYNCKGSLAGDFADGTSGEMPLSFTIQQLPQMKIVLVPNGLDLAGRQAGITLDRTASKVEITAIGTHGVELSKGLLPTSAKPGERIDVEWAKPNGEPIKLRIRAFDEHGFWSELVVSVWSYAIPHEDVVFATNASAIDPTELYKLESALVEAKKVVERYDGEIKVRLYVGGHTDTVGDPSGNQKLSEERALSLARWFKQAGFPGDIYYCGYGEGDLAVKTADNVDEPQNRRAEYLLAGGTPAGKGNGWEPLP